MRYRNIMLAAAAKSYRVLKRNKKIAIIGIILLFVPYIFQSYDNIKIKIKGYQLEGKLTQILDQQSSNLFYNVGNGNFY